jgi:hypothetical protein
VSVTGSDSLWLRLIDVGAALAARGYASPATSCWMSWTGLPVERANLAAQC